MHCLDHDAEGDIMEAEHVILRRKFSAEHQFLSDDVVSFNGAARLAK